MLNILNIPLEYFRVIKLYGGVLVVKCNVLEYKTFLTYKLLSNWEMQLTGNLPDEDQNPRELCETTIVLE